MRNAKRLKRHEDPPRTWCGKPRSEHHLETIGLKLPGNEAWVQAKAEVDALFLEQHFDSLGDGLNYEGDGKGTIIANP